MTDHRAYEVKFSTPDEAGSFTGLASVFNQTDLIGDVVAPGAFRRTLREHKAAGRMPSMLWGHDRNEPIGRWVDIRETPEGLRVKGQLTLDVQRAREVRALLLDDAVSGLSFGFNTKVAERRGNGRLIKDVDLYECSLVSMPCAPNARVSSVKSTSNGDRRRIPEKDSLMSDEHDDGAVEQMTAELPPEMLERIANVETKAERVDEIATRVDRIETKLSRPSARIEVREDQEALQTKAFMSYCRRGLDGMSDLEKKVLAATGDVFSPTADGYQLVPQVFLNELIRNLVLISPMRQVARVQTVTGGPVLIPKRTANLAAAWVAETAQHDTDEPAYTQMSVGVFEARVTCEVTNQLLEDAAFNLASELARDFAEAFALLEGEAFLRGNGTTQPEGFLTSSDFTSTSGGDVTADNLIDLYHAVPSVYANNGTWLMNRATMGEVRKVKTSGTGVYLWTDSLAPGNPPSILGRPVVEMPGLGDAGGSPDEGAVAFGDWNAAYRIFDRVGLEILRDPYTLARNSIVAFHARKRVGGALVKGDAVKGLTA